MELLARMVFWFMLYSTSGWVYETIFCSVTERRFINRGFLNGPYCPIYGCGALFDILLLGKIQNPLLLFALGGIITCTLEYLTSLGMEKLFHARWWDYSERKFNIGGRVCLLGAVVFGAFSVLLIKFMHPAVIRLTGCLSGYRLPVIAALFAAVFGLDLTVTLTGFAGFNDRLAAFSEALAQKRAEAAERMRDSAAYAMLNSLHAEFASKLSGQQRRMVAAFPRLRSVKHNPVLSEMRKHILKKRSTHNL